MAGGNTPQGGAMGNMSQGGIGGNSGMPSNMTQQLNEVSNVPNNRVDQRERNQYRQPST